MTKAAARIWVIKALLIACGISFISFVLTPALGYPLDYVDSLDALKVLLPIFAGHVLKSNKEDAFR